MAMKISRQSAIFGVVGLLVGALAVLGIRFFTYRPADKVHYHANFGIIINGQRQKLDNPLLYEEIEMCSENKTHTPAERAHMHDKVSDVVHVEDSAVTWGQFFQNIGYGVGDNFISTPSQMYLADSQSQVTFILNGEKVNNVTKRVINDKDKLLVDYGNSPKQDLDKEYGSIPATAAKYDASPDPKSCGTVHGSTMMDRLKHIF